LSSRLWSLMNFLVGSCGVLNVLTVCKSCQQNASLGIWFDLYYCFHRYLRTYLAIPRSLCVQQYAWSTWSNGSSRKGPVEFGWCQEGIESDLIPVWDRCETRRRWTSLLYPTKGAGSAWNLYMVSFEPNFDQ
jgi:hypothetical protein